MANCVCCGGKVKERRIDLDYCKMCSVNFDTRVQLINDSDDIESAERNYNRAIKSIEEKDNYNLENKEKVIKYFNDVYDSQKKKIENLKNKKLSSGILYEVKGVRGRTLEVYKNKVVIRTSISIGSVITGNMTDGKKTIYYKDVIGLQFKPSATMIGYLQLETASPTTNNEKSNFFNENTFTFDENSTTNRIMEEIEEYIDQRLEEIKYNY